MKNSHSLIFTTLLSTFLGSAMMPAWCPAADNPWHYDTVVEPSPRPSWMEKVVMICENPWADSQRQTLKPNILRLKEAGFIVMNMYPDGFCRLYSPAKGDTWHQECLAETKAMHAQGMKVLAGVYPITGSRGPRDLLRAHPEWRLHKDEDDKIPEGPIPEDLVEGCLISPFGDALIKLLISKIQEFDIDGYQFDGWYTRQFCRCPACLAAYKKETGEDVPLKREISDPAYLRYMVWRDKKLLDRMIQLRKEVHAVKPDAVLVIWNNNDPAGSVPSDMPEAINCEVDWVNKEWWDSFDISAVWLIKRLRSASGDRPAGVQPYTFLRGGYDTSSGVYHGSSMPSEELFYRMHKVLAAGSIPIIWPGARQAWNDADSKRCTQDLIDFLPLVHQTETLKYAAVLDSYTTLQMARQYPMESKALSYRGGIARALVETHIPFDILSEHNLTPERLGMYKVLILPNVACMSDRVVDVIRQYLSKGGGLVATYETSLYDEWGERRPDFALKDLFGTSYAGHVQKDGPSRIGFAQQSHAITDDPSMKSLMGTRGMTTYWGSFAKIEDTGGAMVAPLTGLQVTSEGGKEETMPWTPLVIGKQSGGRVAYFPAAMDAAYYEAGYPYERMLLANAVRWAAGAEPLVHVDAPMCVQADFLTQKSKDGHRTIVHLLNDTNTTTGHGSKEEKQFAIREEILPVHNVKVTFNGARPTRVVCAPGNQPLKMSQTAEGWMVQPPPLLLHSAVVAEYTDALENPRAPK